MVRLVRLKNDKGREPRRCSPLAALAVTRSGQLRSREVGSYPAQHSIAPVESQISSRSTGAPPPGTEYSDHHGLPIIVDPSPFGSIAPKTSAALIPPKPKELEIA